MRHRMIGAACILVMLFLWQMRSFDRGGHRKKKKKESVPRMTVSRELYENVTDVAMSDSFRVAALVDAKCVVRIEKNRLVFLEESDSPYLPRLCRVEDVAEPTESTSVLMMVNSVNYLEQRGNWLAFLNKASYCRATKRRFYVWIGDLPRAELDARHSIPWRTRCAHNPGNTLNIYKAIAFIVLFREMGETMVLYLDADAWFSDVSRSIDVDRYWSSFGSDTFLFGNQNRYGGPLIPMNGGILALRNCDAAVRFVALWWHSRCGPHDQLPLWSTLFATFSSSSTTSSFSMSPRMFSKYKYAHYAAVKALARDLETLLPADARWNGGGFGRTCRVDQPLELPGGIVILPTAPIASLQLPALRSDANATAPTFCCHTRLEKEEGEGQCDGSRICSRGKCDPFTYY